VILRNKKPAIIGLSVRTYIRAALCPATIFLDIVLFLHLRGCFEKMHENPRLR